VGKKVLVCPLDWGLGHATRSIPLIRALLERDCQVGLASSGAALTLLRAEFSHLQFYSLPEYRPIYPASSPLVASLAFQIPKFISTINRENNEIRRIVADDQWEIVISDNRFGCWSENVPSIFVTHQINIPAPSGLKWLTNVFNHRAIKNFSRCWVPDLSGSESLTGDMTTSNGFPIYPIGFLSRFHKIKAEKKYDVIAVVSGPDPQRQLFENILRDQLQALDGSTLMVRGVPGESHRRMEGKIEVVDHFTASELNQAIAESGIVIARSGYSTIMDLMAVEKPAIFVPTPGQPEQEFLARKLMANGIAFYQSQKDFDLRVALEQSRRFKGLESRGNGELLKKELDLLLS
jgi:uncharacterized protein (TIGR00661 family)